MEIERERAIAREPIALRSCVWKGERKIPTGRHIDRQTGKQAFHCLPGSGMEKMKINIKYDVDDR